jgi:hypothetical protein
MNRMRSARGRTVLLAAAVTATAAAAMFAGSATASAACYASTPASTAYADPIDGDSGLAPEITTVRAGVDAACNYVVDPGVAQPLIAGDAVFVYLDADGNAATGSAVMGGADIVVGTAGTYAGQSPPLRGVWDGASFQFVDAAPIGANVGNGGFSANLAALPVAPGTLTQLVVASIWSGVYSYIDLAPNMGRIALPVNYSPVAPPAPAAAPVAVAAPKLTSAPKVAAATCRVPRTKGLTAARARSRLHAAGCTVAAGTRHAYSAKVRRGRVVGTSVRAGSKAHGSVRLIVSQGRRSHRARSASSVLTELTRLAALDQARLARGG